MAKAGCASAIPTSTSIISEGEPGLEVVCLPYCDGTNAAEIVDLDTFISFWCSVMAEAPGPEPRLAVDR